MWERALPLFIKWHVHTMCVKPPWAIITPGPLSCILVFVYSLTFCTPAWINSALFLLISIRGFTPFWWQWQLNNFESPLPGSCFGRAVQWTTLSVVSSLLGRSLKWRLLGTWFGRGVQWTTLSVVSSLLGRSLEWRLLGSWFDRAVWQMTLSVVPSLIGRSIQWRLPGSWLDRAVRQTTLRVLSSLLWRSLE